MTWVKILSLSLSLSQLLIHTHTHTETLESLDVQSTIIKRFFAIEFRIRCEFSISAKQLKLIFPAQQQYTRSHMHMYMYVVLTYANIA